MNTLRSTGMSPLLPDEIWLIVASFTPEAALRNCYSLNHVFHDLALDLRYKHFELSVKTYSHLENNGCCRRSKRLTIYPASLGFWFRPPSSSGMSSESNKLKGDASTLSQRLLGPLKVYTSVSMSSEHRRVVSIFQSLVNVHSLSIVWPSEGKTAKSWVYPSLRSLNTVMPILLCRIQALSLDLHTTSSAICRLINSLIFPNLSSLSFFTSSSHPLAGNGSTEPIENLLKFIRNHAKTIVTLKISKAQDAVSICRRIGKQYIALPKLRHLSLPLCSPEHLWLDEYYRMLKEHISYGLTSLELYIPPDFGPSTFQLLFSIPIPGLTLLKLISYATPDNNTLRASSCGPGVSYSYPASSPLATIISRGLHVHLSTQSFRTLHTLAIHVPLNLSALLHLLENFTQCDSGVVCLAHLEVHIYLKPLQDPGDYRASASLLSRFFGLVDHSLSNVESLVIIFFLPSRIYGPAEGKLLKQAKNIIRAALVDTPTFLNHRSAVTRLSLFYPGESRFYSTVWAVADWSVYLLPPLMPLLPGPLDSSIVRVNDIRTILSRFPRVEDLNGKSLKVMGEWWGPWNASG
ncbi:hypothetical protein CPB83DRAFT_905792 [Crepidotus variabilis]|uniref:Uncharacterized protein n=1 Tax=Crepidotus variabilis TaxID=179855 RepID=A0A9P6EIT1_9AGAR|nr:hypothetical protein CPB83DRAFT_905792 [Crepidotus variabilis]